MSLLNASDFSDLAGVSASGGSKKPGKFFNVFITGQRRDGQQPGTYQCMKAFDSKDYFVNNANEVHFIPLYVKRYWTKYQDTKNQKGETYSRLIAFGWDEKTPKAEGAKYEYLVAGYLFDAEKKGIAKHTSDYPEADIKKDDPIMIYFKCAGVKCGCGVDLVSRIADKAKTLSPISDNPQFEKDVVSIRRFIVKAGISTRETNYGTRDIFDFQPIQNLPDNSCVKIIEDSKKHLADFEYQFNKTDSVNSASSGSVKEELLDAGIASTSTTVDIDEVPSAEPTSTGSSEFEIDI